MGTDLSKLLETVEGKRAWHAIVHGVAKTQARHSHWTTTKWKAVEHRELSSVLWDDLEGWEVEVGRRLERECIYICVCIYICIYIHIYVCVCVCVYSTVVEQKLTQHCKAITPQVKNKYMVPLKSEAGPFCQKGNYTHFCDIYTHSYFRSTFHFWKKPKLIHNKAF